MSSVTWWTNSSTAVQTPGTSPGYNPAYCGLSLASRPRFTPMSASSRVVVRTDQAREQFMVMNVVRHEPRGPQAADTHPATQVLRSLTTL
ncbi:MAG TPA: hypothetical protein VFV36_09380 [Candidatus Methylomirabilis sp.]|nr:hypothetical protein [Candidatus Methylomirabilis sp.]